PPPPHRLRQQAATGAELLRQTFIKESRWQRVQQEYERTYQHSGFRIRNTSAAQEVKNLAKKLTQVVSRKMRAIKELVTFAESAAASYIPNPAIEESQVSYIDAKLVEESDPRMEYDRMFLQKVVKNQSSVHIPVETYKGDVKVLNDIYWSNELDKVFYSNKRKDPELLWQFYGSQNGIFRMFPGMKWRQPKGKIDVYDVRRRPWSGSMHGQALDLTKLAVVSLINTLGENDFVAVAQYPGRQVTTDHTAKPHLLRDAVPEESKSNGTCFRSFVQATKRNKDRLFAQINDLSAYGIVNFYEAIDFAYSMFEEFYKAPVNNHGALCNSMIMIFTDGDVSDSMDETRQLIRTWRNRSALLDKIRIFTYSVGQHQNPTEPLLEVACSNRGYFAEIPAMGAVTSQVEVINLNADALRTILIAFMCALRLRHF
uniref:VWFA domain-containing protein n=1 Tax=Macrostomum lignano TaxID=282301 RepID=A0A1I8H4F8_9PLAT